MNDEKLVDSLIKSTSPAARVHAISRAFETSETT